MIRRRTKLAFESAGDLSSARTGGYLGFVSKMSRLRHYGTSLSTAKIVVGKVINVLLTQW
jgi:hypothetical protein